MPTTLFMWAPLEMIFNTEKVKKLGKTVRSLKAPTTKGRNMGWAITAGAMAAAISETGATI